MKAAPMLLEPKREPEQFPTEAEIHQMESDLTLRAGERVHVRPIHSDDTQLLQSFHAHLSPETIAFRFFHFMPQLSTVDAEHFTHVDYGNRMALVALRGGEMPEEILGVARYDRIGPQTAEVAFVVADAWQGHGIATALLHQLAVYARAHGFTTFAAVTMPNNQRMLAVFQHCGFPCTAHYREGEIDIHLDISALS